MDEDGWIDNQHPASQDGGRLQAFTASHIYDALLKYHTKEVTQYSIKNL
jgi:hypothetical protein